MTDPTDRDRMKEWTEWLAKMPGDAHIVELMSAAMWLSAMGKRIHGVSGGDFAFMMFKRYLHDEDQSQGVMVIDGETEGWSTDPERFRVQEMIDKNSVH